MAHAESRSGSANNARGNRRVSMIFLSELFDLILELPGGCSGKIGIEQFSLCNFCTLLRGQVGLSKLELVKSGLNGSNL